MFRTNYGHYLYETSWFLLFCSKKQILRVFLSGIWQYMFEQTLFIYLYRSNKHNGQSKSQPTLITQTRSLESSESSSKPTEDASEILKEITAKTEEISLTKWFKVFFESSGLPGRAKPSDVPTDQSKLSILVQFMVETANSIQHRSSKLPWLCYLSLLSYSLWGSPRVRIHRLYNRDIVSSLVKFNYLANENFFNSTLTSLSLSNSSVKTIFLF